MKLSIALVFLFIGKIASAQMDATVLVKKVKVKYDAVNSYVADGKMKTNITFMKVPVAKVKVQYKKPNDLQIKNEKGISFVPKGTIFINMGNVLAITDYQVIDVGNVQLNGKTLRMIKLLPNDENSTIILSTLWIDEAKLLIMKSATNTRENGSYELEMTYGEHAAFGLPSKVNLSFNIKNYKLPKGVSFDYDNGTQKDAEAKMKNRKGKVEIIFSGYKINQGW
jgi:hypothetical protein